MFERYKKTAPVSYWLMVANILVFVGLALSGVSLDAFYAEWGLVPERFLSHLGLGEALTVFTSMFLHGGVWHLLGNLVFLYFFGRLVEPRIGSRRFGLLYAASGLLAAAAQIAIDPGSLVPMIGASGAISGALGAAVLLAPRERVTLLTPFTLFIPITMRIATFGALWLGLQFFGVLGATGGIAFMAHLGGFAGGWLFTRALQRKRTGTAAGPSTGFWSRPSARVDSDARPGPAPRTGFKTIYVSNPSGEVFVYHEPTSV